MEYLLIRFEGKREVLISGVVQGTTNELIQVQAGTHTISLCTPADFMPATQKIVVRKTTVLTPKEIVFKAKPLIVSLSEELDIEPPRGKRGAAVKRSASSRKSQPAEKAAVSKKAPAGAKKKAAAVATKGAASKKPAAQPKGAVKRKSADAR
jgi:hypothetical protein